MRKLYMPLLSLAVAITGASAQTVIAPSAVETPLMKPLPIMRLRPALLKTRHT